MSLNLKEIPPKKALSVVGGVVAVVAGLRDLRKKRGDGTLAMVHTALKIAVAVIGVVVALRASEAVADEAS
jgi:hypothetical protein